MKNKIYLSTIFLLAGLLFWSCDKDETDNISRITYFANIEITGEEYLVLEVGDAYEEEGAIAKAGDETLEVETSGEVDTSTPGVYNVTYSAINEDGYAASKTRTVLVAAEDISEVDLSGSYQGAGFGNQIATVTKLGEGYYFCNKGLASGNNVPVYFYHLGGDQIIVPGNSSPFGLVSTVGHDDAYATLTEDGFEWTLLIGSGLYGPITFVKL